MIIRARGSSCSICAFTTIMMLLLGRRVVVVISIAVATNEALLRHEVHHPDKRGVVTACPEGSHKDNHNHNHHLLGPGTKAYNDSLKIHRTNTQKRRMSSGSCTGSSLSNRGRGDGGDVIQTDSDITTGSRGDSSGSYSGSRGGDEVAVDHDERKRYYMANSSSSSNSNSMPVVPNAHAVFVEQTAPMTQWAIASDYDYSMPYSSHHDHHDGQSQTLTLSPLSQTMNQTLSRTVSPQPSAPSFLHVVQIQLQTHAHAQERGYHQQFQGSQQDERTGGVSEQGHSTFYI